MANQEQSRDGIPRKDKDQPSGQDDQGDGALHFAGGVNGSGNIETGTDALHILRPIGFDDARRERMQKWASAVAKNRAHGQVRFQKDYLTPIFASKRMTTQQTVTELGKIGLDPVGGRGGVTHASRSAGEAGQLFGVLTAAGDHGIRDRSQLLREALLALRHQIASQRLALLGGSEPALAAPPRRRGAALGVAEPDAAYAAGTPRPRGYCSIAAIVSPMTRPTNSTAWPTRASRPTARGRAVHHLVSCRADLPDRLVQGGRGLPYLCGAACAGRRPARWPAA